MDAKLFEKVASYLIDNNYLYNNDDVNRKYGIFYKDILNLDDCGLINSSGMISQKREINTKPILLIDFVKHIVMASAEEGTVVSIQQFPLSRAGRELIEIVDRHEINEDYMKDMINSLKSKNKNIKFSLHKVKERDTNNVSYDLQEMEI